MEKWFAGIESIRKKFQLEWWSGWNDGNSSNKVPGTRYLYKKHLRWKSSRWLKLHDAQLINHAKNNDLKKELPDSVNSVSLFTSLICDPFSMGSKIIDFHSLCWLVVIVVGQTASCQPFLRPYTFLFISFFFVTIFRRIFRVFTFKNDINDNSFDVP